ncbi:MAG TPA: sigma factor [Tepidisphaeraceae bacterium]|nr:sigma factor [Tepidisphaeraceae bacterium]
MLSEKDRALVATYAHLVYRRHWDGVGVFGLIRAAQSYDPTSGISFPRWAYPRIRSAATDELSQTGGMRGCATHGRYKRRRFSAGMPEAQPFYEDNYPTGKESVITPILQHEIIEILKTHLPAPDWRFLEDYYYRCHGEMALLAGFYGVRATIVGYRRQHVLRKCRILLRGYGYHCRTTDCRSQLRRPFVCEQTGEQFATLQEAARRLGVLKSNVLRILQGRRRQTHGYSFRYCTAERIAKVA